jgi:hypothetical protein
VTPMSVFEVKEQNCLRQLPLLEDYIFLNCCQQKFLFHAQCSSRPNEVILMRYLSLFIGDREIPKSESRNTSLIGRLNSDHLHGWRNWFQVCTHGKLLDERLDEGLDYSKLFDSSNRWLNRKMYVNTIQPVVQPVRQCDCPTGWTLGCVVYTGS